MIKLFYPYNPSLDTKNNPNPNGNSRSTRSSTTEIRSNISQKGGSNSGPRTYSGKFLKTADKTLSMGNNFPSEVVEVEGTKFVMGLDYLPESDTLSQLQKRHLMDYANKKGVPNNFIGRGKY